MTARGANRPSRDLAALLSEFQENAVLETVTARLAAGEDPMPLVDECRKGMQIVGDRYSRASTTSPRSSWPARSCARSSGSWECGSPDHHESRGLTGVPHRAYVVVGDDLRRRAVDEVRDLGAGVSNRLRRRRSRPVATRGVTERLGEERRHRRLHRRMDRRARVAVEVDSGVHDTCVQTISTSRATAGVPRRVEATGECALPQATSVRRSSGEASSAPMRTRTRRDSRAAVTVASRPSISRWSVSLSGGFE
jgi:hypothetical protein